MGVAAGIAAANKQYEPNALAERTRRRVVAPWGSLIWAYAGGIPPSLVAVRVEVETGGNPKNQNANEVGFLQLWDYARKYCAGSRIPSGVVGSAGITRAQALDPTTNLICGVKWWLREAAQLEAKHPTLFPSHNAEFWTVVQLYTMIGGGATSTLLRKADVRPGSEYTDLRAYVLRVGENLSALSGAFGSQSTETVAKRIWAAGNMTAAAQMIQSFGSLLPIAAVGVCGYAIYLLGKRWKWF